MAINVELDELRNQADEFDNESGEQQELISRCDTLVEGLDEMWEGSAKDAFQEQWEGLKPTLEQAVELLESISKQLNGVADTMENTDEELASSMS